MAQAEVGKDDDRAGRPSVAGLRRLLPDGLLSATVPQWRRRLQFVGMFLGYCMWQGEIADMAILPSVWAYLLRKPLLWRNLMLDSPAKYGTYMQSLELPPEQVEFLCQVRDATLR